MRKKAIIAGSLVLDIVPVLRSQAPKKLGEIFAQGKATDLSEVVFYLGGEVGNTGLAMHKLGVPVNLIAKVGDDLAGSIAKQVLSSFGAHSQISVVPDLKTSTSISLTPVGMDKISLFSRGASQSFTDSDVSEAQLRDTDLFHFGYPTTMEGLYKNNGEGLLRLCQRVKQAGAACSMDMALPDLESLPGQVDWKAILPRVLPLVDIFLPSVEESLFLLERERYASMVAKTGGQNIIEELRMGEIPRIAEAFLAMGAKLVLLKLGKKGLYLRTGAHVGDMGRASLADPSPWRNREIWMPPFDGTVRSTTGAGDTAIAGFLASFLHGHKPEKALALASITAARSIACYDVVSGISTLEEMDAALGDSHPLLPVEVDAGYWRASGDAGIYYGRKDRPSAGGK